MILRSDFFFIISSVFFSFKLFITLNLNELFFKYFNMSLFKNFFDKKMYTIFIFFLFKNLKTLRPLKLLKKRITRILLIF